MTEKLYTFEFNCGRMGDLEGLFIAKDNTVKDLIGTEVYFGEVLGKHSEIFGEIESTMLVEKSDDVDLIKKLKNIFGNTISGYNPLDYLEE